jgi:hypothetical protein
MQAWLILKAFSSGCSALTGLVGVSPDSICEALSLGQEVMAVSVAIDPGDTEQNTERALEQHIVVARVSMPLEGSANMGASPDAIAGEPATSETSASSEPE